MQEDNNLNSLTSTKDVDPRGVVFVWVFSVGIFIIFAVLPFAVMIANQVPMDIAIKPLAIYFGCFIAFWLAIWIGIKRGDPRITRRQKFAAANGFNFVAYPNVYEGSDITSGSVIASKDGMSRYDSLLTGTRNGYAFRAVDYIFLAGGQGRPLSVHQTVICIDLKPLGLMSFSIVLRSLLKNRGVGKTVSNQIYSELSGGMVVAVDIDHQNDALTISNEFIHLCLSKDFANVEYLKDFKMDRLLVYDIDRKLTSNNYFEWIDYAIALAEELQTAVRNEQQQS